MTAHRTPLTNEYRATVIPSETKPARKEPMTDQEFDELLALERRKLIEQGRPLVDVEWRHKRASVRTEER